MREMAERYKTVLVVGGEGEKCRIVAEGYGFQDVITPGDIIKDNANTTPFRKLTEEELEHSRARNYGDVEIEAIFVFADSRDWAGDQQIILDLCMSKNGRLGTRSETFDEGPPVFFSHNDVIWATYVNPQSLMLRTPLIVCATALAVTTVSLVLEWEPFAPPSKLCSKLLLARNPRQSRLANRSWAPSSSPHDYSSSGGKILTVSTNRPIPCIS